MRGFQAADGTAKPERTPQRAAGAELDPVELRAGGALALAIRTRWKALEGLPQIPDVASWDKDGRALADQGWAFFVETVTLALQRTSRDHLWRRATDDLRTLSDLLKGVGARLWKEIIRPLPRVWPANCAPSGRKSRPGQGTSAAAAAAEWVADAAGGVDPDARRTVAEPESVLARVHAEADEHRRRAELWGLDERIAAQLAAEGWTPGGSVTDPSGNATGRNPAVRPGPVPSRTIRRPGFDPEKERERIRLDMAGRAAAEKARAAEQAAAREALERRIADLHTRWGVTADIEAAQAAAARAADIEAGPALSPGESQARAKAEADRQRGRRTVADRRRAILGDDADAVGGP
jgi:hypothetical protein